MQQKGELFMEMLEQKEGRLIVHLPGELDHHHTENIRAAVDHMTARHLSEKWNLIFQKPYLWTVPESDC